MVCPRRMVSTSTIIGTAYSMRILTSTSIPTETKKMAPKRFFTGSTKRIIFSASTVSDRMLPMTKAPKALLKPTSVLITAMPQQRPRETTSNTSLFTSFRVARRNQGMAKMPITNQRIRKKPILRIEPNIFPPSGFPPEATAASITINTIARISSRIRTLITMPVKRCWRNPKSSNAL